MIKINLLGTDRGQESNWQLPVLVYFGSLLLIFSVFFYLYSSTNKELAQLAIEKESLEKELATLRQKTKEVKELESKRKELNNKLAVIAVLKKNKVGPVKVLDYVNSALPQRAWIEDLAEQGGNLTINGYAIDPTTVSTFAKALSQSAYIKEVAINEVNQTLYKDVEIQKFVIKATVSYSEFLDDISKDLASNSDANSSKPKTPGAEKGK